MNSDNSMRAWILNTAVFLLLVLQSSCTKAPSNKDQIQAGIDANNPIPAFHDAIYDQRSRMSEAIPALKSFLSSPDPWTRYEAAEDLYIAGDSSGFDVLVELLDADHPVRGDSGRDLRVSAAETLAKYREKRAVNALIDYSRKPGNDWVITRLARMKGVSLPDDLVQKVKSSNNAIYLMYNLLLINPQLIKDFAQTQFDKSTDGSGTKLHAAWVMLKSGEKDPYYSYLTSYAKIAIAGKIPPSASADDPYDFSLKILASIKSPENKAMLESALDSKIQGVVEIALVNLIFNQDGTDEARRYLLKQFLGPTNQLQDSSFLMQLAAALNDPEINAAAQSVDDRTEEREWAYFADRKNWSVYSWIDDYVVDLNGSR
jgi:hypothetical protein